MCWKFSDGYLIQGTVPTCHMNLWGGNFLLNPPKAVEGLPVGKRNNTILFGRMALNPARFIYLLITIIIMPLF